MKLTKQDKHKLSQMSLGQAEDYIRCRERGDSENWAEIVATRQCPSLVTDERMRAGKVIHGGLSLPGEPFRPESTGDIRRRAEELRQRGYSIEKIDIDKKKQAMEDRSKRTRAKGNVGNMLKQLTQDGVFNE